MKKLSTVIIILILEIVFHNMNYVNAQPDPKLDELNKVSDYKNNKGTMGNVMNLYTSPPVEGRGVINSRQFLSHDLIFPIEYKSYNEVKTELENLYKIYNKDTGNIQKGCIFFHSHNHQDQSFYYDLYNVKGSVGAEFFQFYSDNRTVSSSNYHIDVFLYKD